MSLSTSSSTRRQLRYLPRAWQCFDCDGETSEVGISYVHIRRVRWQAGYTSPLLRLLDGVPGRRLLAVERVARGIRLSGQRDSASLRICSVGRQVSLVCLTAASCILFGEQVTNPYWAMLLAKVSGQQKREARESEGKECEGERKASRRDSSALQSSGAGIETREVEMIHLRS